MSIFNRPEKKSTWRHEMPNGAIKSVDEMLDLIIEARKEKKAIRIYTVNQGGYLDMFYLISKTKLYRPGSGKHPNPVYGIDNTNHVLYPIVNDHATIGYKKTNNRWYKTDMLLESYIPSLSQYETEHRMFTNKMHAENYSNKLKNDPVYQQEVKDWHAYCDKIFRDMPTFGDYD